MKQIFLCLFLFCFGSATHAQAKQPINATVDSTRIVEAACGECKFGLKGKVYEPN